MLETKTSFEDFCGVVQPKLRQAFAARYGYTDGAEATAEALAYAWEHWERVRGMENAAGYLYRGNVHLIWPHRARLIWPHLWWFW